MFNVGDKFKYGGYVIEILYLSNTIDSVRNDYIVFLRNSKYIIDGSGSFSIYNDMTFGELKKYINSGVYTRL